jgi:hypothetical protein
MFDARVIGYQLDSSVNFLSNRAAWTVLISLVVCPPEYPAWRSLFPPRVTTIRTLRRVHAEKSATHGTSPFGAFFEDEISDSHSLDTRQVRDWGYPVSYPIPFVEPLQFSARHRVAGKAELVFSGGKTRAVFNCAVEACVRLMLAVYSTSRTRMPFTNMRATETAVKSTGRDER